MANRNTRLNWKELYILALTWRGPIHGYEVKRIMAIPPVNSWVIITHSEIYHALERLERRGLIIRGTPLGRGATPFVISEEGARVLAESAEFWLSNGDLHYISEFHTALKLLELLSTEQICSALKHRREELVTQLEWVDSVLASDPPYEIEHVNYGLEGERSFLWTMKSQIDYTDLLLERFGC